MPGTYVQGQRTSSQAVYYREPNKNKNKNEKKYYGGKTHEKIFQTNNKHFAVDPDDRRRVRHRAALGERGILVL